MLTRLIDFCWRMAGYMVVMWLGCAANVGFFGHPLYVPAWALVPELFALLLLTTLTEMGHDHAQKQREDQLELQKHRMDLAFETERLKRELADALGKSEG